MSSCGHCAPRVVAGLAAWGSLPAMLTANRAFALTLTIAAACGPHIEIDITSAATGDAGTSDDPATTTPVASVTGPVELSTSFGDASGTSEGSTGDASSSGDTGGSTSGGEPPPVCAVFETAPGVWVCECDGVGGDITADCGCVLEGDACVCGAEAYPAEACPSVPVCAMVDDRCKCDGDPSNPWLCGCVLGEDGCTCDDGQIYPDYSCGWACAPSGDSPCVCGNIDAPAEWCEKLDPAQPCPT